MSAQPTLFPLPAADGALTERQQRVYEAVREEGSLGAAEAGQILHRGKHSPGETCEWCESDGRAVLGVLRKRGLVTRRHGGLWELRGRRRSSGYDPAKGKIPF